MTQNNTSKQIHSINISSVSNPMQQHFTSSKPDFHHFHSAITTWDKNTDPRHPDSACLYPCSYLTSYFYRSVDFKGFFHSGAMDSREAGQQPLIGSLPGREELQESPRDSFSRLCLATLAWSRHRSVQAMCIAPALGQRWAPNPFISFN